MTGRAQARATVIIPTFGEARFARWAVQSVQNQTVQDLEICIICDGSSAGMVDFFRQLAFRDPRIRVFGFPKSLRTGEPYRDEVIRQTTGKIICYCGHDDLWLPDHVETVEQTLLDHEFTHTIHASLNTPEGIARTGDLFFTIYHANLQDPACAARILLNRNYFGLTFGAHTRAGYFQLAEGWVSTPVKDLPTDLYMWQKWIAAFPGRIATTFRITALCLPRELRNDLSESRRSDELESYYCKIASPDFALWLSQATMRHECRENQLLYDLLEHEQSRVADLAGQNKEMADRHEELLSRDRLSLAECENGLEKAVSARQDLETACNNLSIRQTSLKYLLKTLAGEVLHRLRRRSG